MALYLYDEIRLVSLCIDSIILSMVCVIQFVASITDNDKFCQKKWMTRLLAPTQKPLKCRVDTFTMHDDH